MELLGEHISFWWAVCIGLLLMAGEVHAPTTVFLWTGISCVLVAVPLALLPDFSILQALIAWVLLSAATVLVARRYHVGHPGSGDQIPAGVRPNQYGVEFVGLVTVLRADSANGETRVDIRGANWGLKLPGGDLKAGTAVRIKAVEGIYLVAEPSEPGDGKGQAQ